MWREGCRPWSRMPGRASSLRAGSCGSAPPRLVVIRAAWAAEFQKAGEKSARLAQCCEPLAREAGALFLNAGLVVSGDQLDGVHLTEAEHEALARAVAEKVLGEPGPGDEGPEGI